MEHSVFVRLRFLLPCLLALVGAGCSTFGFVKDPTPWLAAADWQKAERIRVALAEYSFTPQVIYLDEAKPYILELVNIGQEKHYFVSEDFFRSVATRKAEIPSIAELKAPHFTALELYPGQTLQLYFVAVQPGTYDLTCTIPGHSQKGMTGAIQIRPKPPAQAK